jgi:acyl-CoA reductase-like NAD-dependent aldehyde dehydrogenase
VGVIAGLVPVTNPTSTVLFKALISAKTRNAIVLAPHPRAVRSSGETARVMQEAAQEAGAPADLIQSMSRVSVAGTDALMRHHRTDLVLATGSRAMVLAAYSSGKPTYAVGPGNVPAYIHASVRDVDYAARPDEGIATAVAQLRFGGDGHTSAVHAGDEAVISRFAEAAPAYRVLVNTPSLFGAMGYSTGVDRTFMIGTGTIGGSISSDNIGVRHLINRKRVAGLMQSGLTGSKSAGAAPAGSLVEAVRGTLL